MTFLLKAAPSSGFQEADDGPKEHEAQEAFSLQTSMVFETFTFSAREALQPLDTAAAAGR